ncbi:MAG: hypothetical protein WKF73_10315 [Nocardioidaceae bacterium]
MTDEGASADWDVSRMSVDAWFWMVAGVRRVKKASIWAAGLSAAVVVGLGCGVIIVTRPSSLLPLASTIAVGAVLVASNASWLVRKIGYTRVVAPLRSLLSETLHYGPDPSDLARLTSQRQRARWLVQARSEIGRRRRERALLKPRQQRVQEKLVLVVKRCQLSPS